MNFIGSFLAFVGTVFCYVDDDLKQKCQSIADTSTYQARWVDGGCYIFYIIVESRMNALARCIAMKSESVFLGLSLAQQAMVEGRLVVVGNETRGDLIFNSQTLRARGFGTNIRMGGLFINSNNYWSEIEDPNRLMNSAEINFNGAPSMSTASPCFLWKADIPHIFYSWDCVARNSIPTIVCEYRNSSCEKCFTKSCDPLYFKCTVCEDPSIDPTHTYTFNDVGPNSTLPGPGYRNVNSSIVVRCAETGGIFPSGNLTEKVMTCMSNGTWSPAIGGIPSCVPACAVIPHNPSLSTHTHTYHDVGANITQPGYRTKDSYVVVRCSNSEHIFPIGNLTTRVMTCMSNGTWSPASHEIPSCVPDCRNGSATNPPIGWKGVCILHKSEVVTKTECQRHNVDAEFWVMKP